MRVKHAAQYCTNIHLVRLVLTSSVRVVFVSVVIAYISRSLVADQFCQQL